jgi:signal transduction histidine kinase
VTVRVRLTLLYSGLFAACGVLLVAITYGLLAHTLTDTAAKPIPPAEFAATCEKASDNPEADPGLLEKCKRAYEEGVVTGATGQRQATLEKLLRYSLGALFATTLAATAAGWIVAGRVLRPIHQITEAARNASEARLGARLSLTGPRDELRELADTFDDMLDRLQTAFEGQRRFIANAGHELRTPLAVLRTAVDVVLAKPEPTREELLGMGQDVRAAVSHAQALIDALLTLARTDQGRFDRDDVDLATVAEDALDAAGSTAGTTAASAAGTAAASAAGTAAASAAASAASGSAGTADGSVRLHTSLAPAPTTGDPILLERLAANLLDNAARYNVAEGSIWVTTSTVDSRAVLTVDNTGPVVAPEAVGGLFEPFRRLHDRTGDGGFGLGLAIVASIAAAHGGRASAGARPGGGLTVTVSLPGRDGRTASEPGRSLSRPGRAAHRATRRKRPYPQAWISAMLGSHLWNGEKEHAENSLENGRGGARAGPRRPRRLGVTRVGQHVRGLHHRRRHADRRLLLQLHGDHLLVIAVPDGASCRTCRTRPSSRRGRRSAAAASGCGGRRPRRRP